MRIAVYVNTKKKQEIDLMQIDRGSPGLGGSDYLFFALPLFLNKYSNKLDVTLFVKGVVKGNKFLKTVTVDNCTDAVRLSQDNNIDLFIFRPSQDDNIICRELERYKLNALAWLHNDFQAAERKAIANCRFVKRIVCVGHEQLDMYRDHKAFYKSTVIYNAINTMGIPDYSNVQKKNIVAYTGALIDLKGFHVLAKVWKQILKKVPDAELWVLGTASLYGSNSKLGKWGIADEEYEKIWRPYLSDENGDKLESVRFLGEVGIEKFELYKNIKVGVVNPTGKTETFCLCGIEYGICGIPVVTAKKNGLLDTVIDKKTGLLVKNSKQLTNSIVKLLKDNKINSEMGSNARSFIKENFEWQNIIKEWIKLFDDVINNVPCEIEKIKGHWFSNYKFLREGNRLFKKYTGLSFIPSIKELRMLSTSPYRILKKHLKR